MGADLVGIDKTFMDHIARVRNPLIKSQEDFQKQFANLHFAVKTSAPLSSFPSESEEGDDGGAGADVETGGKDRGDDEDNAGGPGRQGGREWCDLVPNGGKTKVTLSNRDRYVDLAVHYRLHEFDEAAAAMRSGLGMLVPERALRLCTGMDLEILVCGDPRVSVEDLMKHTEYVGGWDADDSHVKRFWRVVEGFSHEQRSRLLRFVWGRSRLPRGKNWPARFKLTRKGAQINDAAMPIGHTCFFQLELPTYSSEEILRTRLTAAITYGIGEFMIA